MGSSNTSSPPHIHHKKAHTLSYMSAFKFEREMEIESVKCVCCGLREDCTEEYINEVKGKFEGKWLCGLCAEAVRDEMKRGKRPCQVDDAVKAHMLFCRKFKLNPAVRVADGMRQMLRRRSADFAASSSS